MMDFLQNFHFLRPWALIFLLIPLGLLLKKIHLSEKGDSSWEDICDKNLLKFLLVNNSNHKKVSVKRFIYTGLICAAISAAGPCWKKTEIPSLSVENPNMIILSLAPDMALKDITPSRLERAKFVVSDIVEHVDNGQFGLMVYSEEPYVISPITDDAKLIKNLLPQIAFDIVPDRGDRADRAIDFALERFKSAGYTNGNIILFASDIGQNFDTALNKAKELSKMNYTLNIIDTSYSGNEKLKLLSDAANGLYLSILDSNQTRLVDKINSVINKKAQQSNNLRSTYLDYGYYLLFIPLFCVLMFFRKGLFLVALCCFSQTAFASAFRNSNQEALILFNQEQYEDAYKKFTTPEWRAISLYKQEKYEDALKELSAPITSDDFYNQGVIFTKLCQYPEAVKSFEHAIGLNPDNDDAVYNKNIIEDLIKRAKDDPSLLNCDNNQQENQNQQQEQDSQNSDQNNSSENDKQDQNTDNNQEQNQNDQQKQDQEQGQNQQQQNTPQNSDSGTSSEDKEQNGNKNVDKQSPKDNSNNSEEEQQQNTASTEQDNSQNTEQTRDESPSAQTSKANEEQSSDPSKKQQEAAVAEAKESDNEQKYDEEALALQRRYREIPEDTGGLLREFIKKEYMKGRYRNETM
jgi:Ca-activated chloride channel family protein